MPHFEIQAESVDSAKPFYSGLFGWSFRPMKGAEEADYHLASGERIGKNAGLTVGIMRRMGASPRSGTPIRGGTMTFEVDDCDERYAWALANGGGEALPPIDYPGMGRAAYVEDGQGNVVGMITPEGGN